VGGIALAATACAASALVPILPARAEPPTLAAPFVSFKTSGSPSRVVAADFDGDGRRDLALACGGGSEIAVLLGTGDGGFAPFQSSPALARPRDLAAGDVDGDGFDDVVMVGGSGPATASVGSDAGKATAAGGTAAPATASYDCIAFLRGRGDGRFAARRDLPITIDPADVELGDLDGDGHLDLVVTSLGTGEVGAVTIVLSADGGNFLPALRHLVGSQPRGLVLADFDGDGHLDIATANAGSSDVSLLRGQGEGSVKPAGRIELGIQPLAIAAGDVNADGFADLAIATFAPPSIRILLGTQSLAFAPAAVIPLAESPAAVAIADLDKDGNLDVAATLLGPSLVIVSRGLGGGELEEPVAYEAGEGSSGIAVTDVDADGDVDVATACLHADTASILLNNGNATFGTNEEYDTGLEPAGTAIGDLNGDRRADVVVTSAESGMVLVYLNEGDGILGPAEGFATAAGAIDVAIGRLDDDKHPDLAVANQTNHSITVLQGDGKGVFTLLRNLTVPNGPVAVRIADVNGDGRDDLVTASRSAGSVSYLRGLGGGMFAVAQSFIVPFAPSRLAVADFDADSHLDVVVGGAPTESRSTAGAAVLFGDGRSFSRTFSAALPGNLGVATGDFDADGKPDFAAALQEGDVAVQMGNGDGTFQLARAFPTQTLPQDIVSADFDGDGKLDLAVAHGSHAVSILRGSGDGRFDSAAGYGCGGRGQRLGLGDLNGDEKPDLVVSSFGYGPEPATFTVLMNQTNTTPATGGTRPSVAALTAARVDVRVVLTWRLDGAAPLAASVVRVERAGAADGPWSEIGNVPVKSAGEMTWLDPDPGDSGWYRVQVVNRDGTVEVAGPVAVAGDTESALAVLQALEDDAGVRIRFRLPPGMDASAQVAVHDVRGRRLWAQAVAQTSAGEHEIVWPRRDDAGLRASRGVYLVRLEAAEAVKTRKVILVRD
jgi:hypothetical protein